MKVNELRKVVAGHSADDLRALVVELYKALPKQHKEDEDLQRMLRRPGEIQEIRKTRRAPRRPDMGALLYDVESFLSDARKELYIAPNRIIPKRQRSKWRFQVKRFIKDLLAAAEDPEDLTDAARLLEELYGLLCTASAVWLFPSEDPFRSVGIPQPDFLDHVLTLRQASEPPGDFVRRGLTLALEHELDRDTLRSNLTVVLLRHLKTPALRELALEECTARLTALGPTPSRRTGRGGVGTSWRSDYEWRDRNRGLSEMGFRCHLALGEPEEAIEYFRRHWRWSDNAEVHLFCLLDLLDEAGLEDLWIREYDRAVTAGVKPRDQLKRRRNAGARPQST